MNKKLYKFYKCTTILLFISNLILASMIMFFNSEIGIVRTTTEFGADYGFFYKKKNMHRIYYFDPVGEQDLDQLSDEAFHELSEFCMAASKDNNWYDNNCGSYFNKEVKRRASLRPHSFILTYNGEIYRNSPYIMQYDRKTIEGITNDKGETETVYVSDKNDVHIEIDWEAYKKQMKTQGNKKPENIPLEAEKKQ
ncbi:hypothetical protein [Avibacterium sp. 21-594]|uniref:hypothetical protein n=1 Tax=Avibacterium sp. 21-594 TaxID=2911535 RepID=UPI0022456D32|nr:hypothetical protein [Avibacterium sp. 21-594]MCW9716006.1 hypothetical protein [Avibacterium sp. 21-594]